MSNSQKLQITGFKKCSLIFSPLIILSSCFNDAQENNEISTSDEIITTAAEVDKKKYHAVNAGGDTLMYMELFGNNDSLNAYCFVTNYSTKDSALFCSHFEMVASSHPSSIGYYMLTAKNIQHIPIKSSAKIDSLPLKGELFLGYNPYQTGGFEIISKDSIDVDFSRMISFSNFDGFVAVPTDRAPVWLRNNLSY